MNMMKKQKNEQFMPQFNFKAIELKNTRLFNFQSDPKAFLELKIFL
jgi:hypothetical protein